MEVKRKPKNRIKLDGSLKSPNPQMYMQINLQDLEQYTQDVLAAERERRRRCWMRVIVCLMVTGLIVFVTKDFAEGTLQLQRSHHPNFNNSDSDSDSDSDNNGTHNATAAEIQQDMKEEHHPLVACEIALDHDALSFHEMALLFQKATNTTNSTTDNIRDSGCQSSSTTRTDCDWLNPTQPAARQTNNESLLEEWEAACRVNLAKIDYMVSSNKTVDVALIGNSLDFHMFGSNLGSLSDYVRNDQEVVDEYFSGRHSEHDNDEHHSNGLALGISGDRASNLLYRFQQGELSIQFQPRVWWIIIGESDFEMGLSAKAIVAGIVTVVESIRNVHGPHTPIVINSLLPKFRKEENDNVGMINEMLSCYVKAQSLIDDDTNHHSRVLHFFNASNLFEERREDGSLLTNPVFVEQSSEVDSDNGELLWGEKIVETTFELIQRQDSANENRGHVRRVQRVRI